MASIDQPTTHREEVRLLLELADHEFAFAAVVLTMGLPLAAFISGVVAVMFYVHVALGAFWFGLDFFFKFILGPSLDASPDEAAGAVNHRLIPKMVAVAEPLSIGVVGSGIGLAALLGYWAEPTVWLWGALGIGVLMILVGLGPIHLATTRMIVELDKDNPDDERLRSLFGTAQKWGLVQTVFMLTIVLMMVGLRGLI